jgi:hydroxymethylpyrimidine pyrophosphatase-like HAD family hydrolase
MFKTVKYSIAMGNAADEIKAQALKITDSLDNRGVEKVLLEILNGKM